MKKMIVLVVLACICLLVLFAIPTFACNGNCACSAIVQSPWLLCRDIAIICGGLVITVWIISKIK